MSQSADFPYRLVRTGVVMRPDRDDTFEVEGVLNPASATAPDGTPLLYPRIVSKGNYSRIGLAEVEITDGVPTGVQRKGVLLAPDRGWEHGTHHGGVEDPRVTRIEALGQYVMAYVAYGPYGPKAALAVSSDAVEWRRLGPVQFAYDDALDTDMNLFPNKDLAFFPEAVTGPDGTPCLGFMHRPMWDLSMAVGDQTPPLPTGVDDEREAIWLSYVRLADAQADLNALCRPWGHREIVSCEYEWESLKIGGGTPPIRVDEGWLTFYHGVSGSMSKNPFEPQKEVRYVAGGLILDADDPSVVVARSAEPLLVPETEDERVGVVGNVVFPTGVLEVDGVTWVFYGMADQAIGVARVERV
ncbi:glycoside hydrolase family 130 protein [Aestuariimicrobium ganziense]|uniref:glycoside hydrolase family 130 protein n=1 Tax=Aestuariimicrobium ganziense TaxID=2773677 RepID=UPI001F4636B3|nr:glycosidase [Aestuariimicrobium ganziense]